MSDCYININWEALTAIGTIAVAIVAIWGDWFRAKFASPKVRLVVQDMRGDKRFVNPHGEFPIANPQKAIYFCLRVENRRPWLTAKNCKVRLRAVHRRVPDGQFCREPLVVPLFYKWSPASYEVSDVQDIKHDAILDFGRIIERDDKFEPTLDGTSSNFNMFVKADEVVRYSLQVVADNFVSPKSQVFEVEWNGFSSDVEEIKRRQSLKPILKVREVTQDELKQTKYVDPNLNPSPLDPR